MSGSQIIFAVATCMAVIVIAAAAYWYFKFYKLERFVCPKCGCEFKPNAGRMLLSNDNSESKVVKCPKCGCKERMQSVKADNSLRSE